MRLIKFDTLELVEFNERSTPPYAILSHTWSSEEVLFRDWNTPSHGAHLRGYTKISGFATIASGKHRLKYGWVDTCCIDKTNSAELTEAINSMFRYYANAVVCVVHLEDVSGSSEVFDDSPEISSELDIAQRICCSRWLTRGWTLQELIAPERHEFYSASYELIGSLSGQILTTLSLKTGIPESVLSSAYQPSQWNIAQRMSWASNRETTRIEDEAYCLLGIFDVSLPLIYGEGSRAFVRLQEEIMKTSADHSLFAWGFSARSPSEPQRSRVNLFASSPSDFKKKKAIERCYGDVPGWIEAFEMTNLGLRISLPLIRCGNQPSIYHGVLNCRFKNDQKGPISLNLREVSQAKSKPHGGTETGPRLLAMLNMGGTGPHDPHCGARHAYRLSVVDEEDLINQPKRLVTILRNYVGELNSIPPVPSAWKKDAPKRVLLSKYSETDRLKITIHDAVRERSFKRAWAYPRCEWDHNSDVWYARSRGAAAKYISTLDPVWRFSVVVCKGRSRRHEVYQIALFTDLSRESVSSVLSQRAMLRPHLQSWRPGVAVIFKTPFLRATATLWQQNAVGKTFYIGEIKVTRSFSWSPLISRPELTLLGSGKLLAYAAIRVSSEADLEDEDTSGRPRISLPLKLRDKSPWLSFKEREERGEA